jgi:hypothetical protein
VTCREGDALRLAINQKTPFSLQGRSESVSRCESDREFGVSLGSIQSFVNPPQKILPGAVEIRASIGEKF